MSYESGKVTATISGAIIAPIGFPAPATGQTRRSAYYSGASGGTVITVTAGKTFHLMGFCLSDSGNTQAVVILNDGTAFNGHYNNATTNQLQQVSASVPLQDVAATKTITVTGGGTLRCAVWGYED
jgi:hypothetical protein